MANNNQVAPMDSALWKIKVISNANINLTAEEIHDAIYCFKDPE